MVVAKYDTFCLFIISGSDILVIFITHFLKEQNSYFTEKKIDFQFPFISDIFVLEHLVFELNASESRIFLLYGDHSERRLS